MKCSTKNNANIKTNKSVANKDKNKLKGVTAKSLLTNAANMKITKAIVNSKQNRKNLHKAIINGAAELFTANEANAASTRTTATTEGSNKSICKRKELHEKDIEGQKTSFHNEQSPYPTKMLISNDSEPMTIAGCLLSRKEIEYRQEERSPIPMQTTNSPQSSLSSTITTAPTITATTTTTTTGLLNEQIGSGRVHHFHNHHNHHQNHNQQQQQQPQQQQQLQQQHHQASESRFAANLNLSLLAGKSATLLSVVNETSNQTVLRTTTITNTIAEDSQHMKNFQLNKNEKDTVTNIHFDTAKSTTAITAAAAAAATATAAAAAAAAAANADKLQDNCNGDVCEAATAVIIHRHHTQTTDKVNKCNIESNNSNNSQINRNDNNNSSAKSVINAATTTPTTTPTTAATTISENYQEKLENCEEEFEKTLNNELQQQQQQQPVNYRGVNNTVIITNYNHNAQQQQQQHHHHHHPHHPHHQHQHSQQQQQHSENSFSVQTVEYDSQTSNILSSTSDPNLNLAVIGIPTPQSANQSAQQQSITSSEQLQEHAHHYTHQPSADQWLNVYSNCAYDLSLNHTQSVNDLTSQLLTSTLTQLQQHSQQQQQHHHHHHHHTHPQNLAYYPAHLINPGAAITAATTLANGSYTLHDDTMRSNTTLYSTSYAPTGHEHLHQHTQLVGTTATTPHTPTNIDEVIQDTLKGECLDDHHTAVSYLTNLNSVVDAQTLKDTYHHSANLGHELSTLTAIAPAHLQSSNHLQTIHHLHQNNSVSSGGNSPSPSSALSQTGDVATLQSFTQLTNANASSHRDIYGLLTTDQNSMSYFTSPPSPVLSQG
uniref:Uncharacterized protein n=1 Tax=Glossina pallidipes TaxID=7398 RepID=A0A1A9ZR10_GLOPL